MIIHFILMNVFITASNKSYKDVRDYCVYTAKHYGKFDKVVAYDIDTMIDDNYRKHHSQILEIRRGAGLWLWKVYFIRKALYEECDEGDILFYADAASFFFRSATTLLGKFEGNVFASKLPFVEEEYTKREVFEIMGLTSECYTKTNQFHASILAFKKNNFSEMFVNEWLSFCEDIRVISPYFCGIQIPSFVEHRNDQSVFSLLCKKYKIEPSEDPSERGITGYRRYKGSTYIPIEKTTKYPFCIMLHKRSNLKGLSKLRCWLKLFKIICVNKLNQL